MELPDVTDLLSPLELAPREYGVQASQTRFRRQLVEAWDIRPGSSVIEIGCGQGDMTLVLGAAVGLEGHVTAIDAAEETDGSPLTFAEATARLRRSPHAQSITFMFGTDVLSPAMTLPRERYDAAVLAHSSWYMPSPDHLRRILRRVADWTDHLCLSEWDLQPKKASQIPHALAAQFQAQMVALSPNTGFNIRALMSRPAIERILEEAGWRIDTSMSIVSTELQDGQWEVANCLEMLEAVAHSDNGHGLRGFDFDDMARLTRRSGIESLSSFSLTCRRGPRGT